MIWPSMEIKQNVTRAHCDYVIASNYDIEYASTRGTVTENSSPAIQEITGKTLSKQFVSVEQKPQKQTAIHKLRPQPVKIAR